MKRILCILCALLCVISFTSCKDAEEPAASGEETTDTTGFVSEPIDLTDDMISAIMAWREVQAWDITSTAMMTMVDDGDTENPQGYYLSFDGSMIKGEKGNLYKADTMAMNSSFPVEIAYEMYYYDGWAYQIYRDATVEELNTYEKYVTTEEYFLADYDGVVPTLASESEFEKASASKSGETVIVSVPLGEGRARKELLGDIDLLAQNNGVSEEDISVSNVVVSYALKEGKLVGFIGSYELSFYVGDVHRVYSMEKSSQINAVDGDVQSFTLPDGYENFENIG